MKELKKYIEPIQCYCALNELGYPILDSFNATKSKCFKFSDLVVKVGLQLLIPIEYKCYRTLVSPPMLAKGLYCTIYKGDTTPCLNSINKSAKGSRESVDAYTNTRYKVVKCEIILLTQQQHLRKSNLNDLITVTTIEAY